MSRYVSKGTLTVSQEFTIIEAILGGMLAGAVYKKVKKIRADKKVSLDEKVIKRLETRLARLGKLEKISKSGKLVTSSFKVNMTTLGDRVNMSAPQITKHVSGIIGTLDNLFDMINEPLFELGNDSESDDEVLPVIKDGVSSVFNRAELFNQRLWVDPEDITNFHLQYKRSEEGIDVKPAANTRELNILLELAAKLNDLLLKYESLNIESKAKRSSAWNSTMTSFIDNMTDNLLDYIAGCLE